MSAFMFVMKTEAIKKMTLDELKEVKIKLEDATKDVDASKLTQCTFDFDVYYGRLGSLGKVNQEIENRESGTDAPIGVLVPGYNPKGGA
jgi:hypothetical protein